MSLTTLGLKEQSKTNLKSPLLKARKKRSQMLRQRLYRWLMMLWLLGIGYWIISSGRHRTLKGGDILNAEEETLASQPPTSRPIEDPWTSLFNTARRIEANSLTAILPVTSGSLPRLQDVLLDVLRSPSSLKEVILATPDGLSLETRKILWEITLTLNSSDYPDVSLHRIRNGSSTVNGILDSASEASSDWLLLLDEDGLQGLDAQTKELLLNPRVIPLPIGPSGKVYRAHNVSCFDASWSPQPAVFLTPPMVMPATILVPEDSNNILHVQTWEGFGDRVSRLQLDMVGGLVVGHSRLDSNSCLLSGSTLHQHQPSPVSTQVEHASSDVDLVQELKPDNVGHFAVIMDTKEDLRLFSNTLCRLTSDSHRVRAMLSRDSSNLNTANEQALACDISLDSLSKLVSATSIQISEWLRFSLPDIVIISSDDDVLITSLEVVLQNFEHGQLTLIRIPRADLPYCDWMGALTLQEWQHWNLPKIDVSVITNDRPESLTRLLKSLQHARYFGDTLELRINMDSPADGETKKVVAAYHWPHGSTFVNHRIIHGGLLPAVVESWYPLHNDSYGLIFEDDVEVSPLFYAWVKMAILRYRYGNGRKDTSRLFGISLYQQKTIELRPEGRRPFNARSIFLREGLPRVDTPYLSQIPCSWGAVYFPEHWREFHDYISVRLSELRLGIGENVVPNLRSNNWTKSWKKYFIELSYLRGYVMLYPNYDNFTSLSTNHLEIGSHVKDTPKELYEQKKGLFYLPLLRLPVFTDSPPSTGILDLPARMLPTWSLLPTLDHQGLITSLDDIIKKGSLQRTLVFGCSLPVSVAYDAQELTCVDSG